MDADNRRSSKSGFLRMIKRIFGLLATALLGAVAAVIIAYVLWARAQPPLQPWHEVELEEDFSAERAQEVRSLNDYLALEERVYAELEAKVYAQTPTGPDQRLNRFSPGSASDPRHRAAELEPNLRADSAGRRPRRRPAAARHVRQPLQPACHGRGAAPAGVSGARFAHAGARHGAGGSARRDLGRHGRRDPPWAQDTSPRP
jgi:hypothetical protein